MLQECNECERPSNNKYVNCPPIMADGRHFTDYRPRCDVNYLYPRDKPVNSYDYRMYLVGNAESLLKEQRRKAYEQNMCGPCVEPYNVGTMLPEQSMVECDTNTCKFNYTNPAGLGTGRKYTTFTTQQSAADEQMFMSMKQQEQLGMSRYANCCGTPATDAQLYSLDGKNSVSSKSYARPTVPGGGMPFQQ